MRSYADNPPGLGPTGGDAALLALVEAMDTEERTGWRPADAGPRYRVMEQAIIAFRADVTRIEPRALLIPPGFPDFMSRRRVLGSGAVQIEGRAWSGWAQVTMGEVSVDGGDTWAVADLEPAPDSHTTSCSPTTTLPRVRAASVLA